MDQVNYYHCFTNEKPECDQDDKNSVRAGVQTQEYLIPNA